MQTAEIRRRFLAQFERNGHTLVPSVPLPFPDPNLLFVNAGMVPFAPYFTGQQTAPYARAVSVQKCLRTLDIEEVGKTSRHNTFFQMCGNFSFGDYFKAGAIDLAWSLLTDPVDDGGFGLDPELIWPTVYLDDEEAVSLWRGIGLPDERIQRRGMKDNFWSMGIPGPCGPSSEIFYDRGAKYGPDGGPVVDEDRFVEIWNLVFMQNLRGPGSTKEDFEILGELPAKNIDTGMGLERVATILQRKDNLYEIDEVFGVIEKAAELSGRRYGADVGDDVRFRVVADHVRSALMLIADGTTPGNEGRGYVLRRLLRRAVRSMRLLGVEDPSLPELLPVSKDVMKASYPELERDWNRISTIAYAEEEAFRHTLRTGTLIFDQAAAQTRAAGSAQLAGDKAFALHDTYGFPIDLTLEMAAEQGLDVDEGEFRRLMGEQRARAKEDSKAKRGQHADTGAYRQVQDSLTGGLVFFTGYDEVAGEGVVRGLVSDDGLVQVAREGDEVEVILDSTPFYAESGGQLADHGTITLADGATAQVLDVQKPIAGLIAHRVRILSGDLPVGATALAVVDGDRRRSICRAHTATHMVHKAIREVLGDTATQAGSENAPGRLRFDFTASGAVPPAVMAGVEERINELVVDDLGVDAEVMNINDALRSGAMALFGEKYGDEVRVVSVGGDWSRELCGGTHAQRSGQLGMVKLLGESSIGAGKRRVEALVGTDAYRFLASEHLLVSRLSETLNVRSEELPDRIADIVARLRAAEKEIEQVRVSQLLASAGEIADSARDIGGVAFVGHRAPDGAAAADVRRLALDVRNRLGGRPGVVAVIGSSGERPSVVVALSEDARARGLSANELVKVAAGVLGGSGGGKDDVAQGGGADASAIGEALVRVERAVAARVGV